MDQTTDHASFLLERPAIARWLTPLLLVGADGVVATLALEASIYLRNTLLPALAGLSPFSPVRSYLTLWPVLLFLVAMRAIIGLYPGYGLNDADELRRQTVSTALVAFFVFAGGALFEFSRDYSRIVVVLSFALIAVGSPMVRAAVKRMLSSTGTFGASVWVVGNSKRSNDLVHILRTSPALGLRVVGQSKGPPPKSVSCSHCLLVPDEMDNVSSVLDDLNARFRHVLLLPNLLDVSSVWVTARDIKGHLGLELQNNLQEPANRATKRIFDALFVVFVGPLTLVMLGILSILIRVDSSGPVLFRHTRIGRDGRAFKMVKFRTMYVDAKERLTAHLKASPEALAEWQRVGKLCDDPRVTRLGHFLRRWSLDELPQVWNILNGTMSLVGPRAITREELRSYGKARSLYKAVLPGITGLWQVSGRNELDYQQRERLDTYYVRNWSVWLDITIIARTIATVFRGKGSY